MKHKYIRHSELGIMLFPMSHDLYHSHIGRTMERYLGHGLISAGFAELDNGTVICHGRSESLSLGSKPEDSEVLAKQLGLAVTKVAS